MYLSVFWLLVGGEDYTWVNMHCLFKTFLFVTACLVLSLADQTEQDSERGETSGVILFDLGRTERTVSDARQMRRYLTEDGPDSPLYRGYGTHFVYVYVGTPRQRVSVIVDTGSHHTAFPCIGCSQCGDHTDLYFNPKASSSIVIPKCGGKNCVFSQSYTEGSMWTAYRVRDRFFIGGETVEMASGAEKHDVEFTFGCQTKETGLFRTQMENGIMGLSADAKTLPNTLYQANMTTTNCFALCFLPTGGVMSLGGSHPALKQGKMGYAQMIKKSGYFTVRVLSMYLRQAGESELHELKVPMAKLNSGKGVIVDSGTTDTYLPSAISSTFQSLFKKLCGTSYTKATFAIAAEDVKKLPTVVLHLQKWHPSGSSTEFVQVEFPPMRYLEPSSKKGGKDMFVFRLYLTERSGGVLGANFMTGQNVEFDQKQQRVGFAPSHCRMSTGEPLYKGMTKPVKLKKHRLRKLDDVFSQDSSRENTSSASTRRRLSATAVDKSLLRATGPCSAQCDGGVLPPSSSAVPSSTLLRVAGNMPAAVPSKTYKQEDQAFAVGRIPCSLACHAASRQQVRIVPTSISPTIAGAATGSSSNVGVVAESEECAVMPWEMCSQDCTQSRGTGNGSQALSLDPACRLLQTASRPCWRQLCPFRPAEECATRLNLVLPSFKVKRWNDLWKEDVVSAVAKALKVTHFLRLLHLCSALFVSVSHLVTWLRGYGACPQVDPGKVDIPEPLRRTDTSVTAVVHVRTIKVRMQSDRHSGTDEVCPQLQAIALPDAGADATSAAPSIRDMFVEELHRLKSSIW